MKRIFYSLTVCAIVALAATSCSNKAHCWKMVLDVPSVNVHGERYFWGTSSEVETESSKMLSEYASMLREAAVGAKVDSKQVKLSESECNGMNADAE